MPRLRLPSPGNATWSEIGKITVIWFLGLIAIWVALAFRTGGF